MATPAPSTPAKPPAPDPCAGKPDDMACVPAGSFVRGLDEDPHRCIQMGQPISLKPTTQPAATIELDTYFIDITEVTIAAYRKCVEKKACRDVRPLYYDYDAPEQPMTGESWFDADKYCRSLGKRLPTEAEWEKAARGPEGQRTSFGNEDVTCDNAVVKDKRGRSCGVKKRGGEGDKGKVLPVKSRPAGHYGLYDMMGNAEEWVADWWTKSYAVCGEACLGKNPKGPCGGGAKLCPKHSYKVVRGGSWYWEAEHATAYHRRRHFPANELPGYHHFGFRCARSANRTTH
jgi:formylglycine-generating enzyme required for sulfatase activity